LSVIFYEAITTAIQLKGFAKDWPPAQKKIVIEVCEIVGIIDFE
jgi:hypothetical protein